MELESEIRPPPNANAIVHLPFPSSPPSTAAAVASLLPFVKFLERLVQPVAPPAPCVSSKGADSGSVKGESSKEGGTRRFSVSSLMSSFPSSAPSPYGNTSSRSRSSTSPSSSFAPRLPKRTRPLKVLIYSSDGYTESSVPALCLLMAMRSLSLPEAYLELQVVKKRSFFVYQGDLGMLRRVEGRLASERESERARVGGGVVGRATNVNGSLSRVGWPRFGSGVSVSGGRSSYHTGGRPGSNSISIPSPSLAQTAGQSHSNSFDGSSRGSAPPPQPMMIVPSQGHLVKNRPRANTSPWLPSLFEDHQSWFNDPRFDGSFPSRVLPFLYLGNL